ncbi:hypothetical protein [Tumebacillus flagellatus]|uniref:Uncharacterized protein n=1 Tax=Tumebacillus flagellatus TaxID=1157490 RepID=A0A074LSI7_9BACL|nr:hypothetical protein [Tumebacillus flagellatus]KEO83450.1 hypothetical protein EL26_09525 [Tumebacillus flagellatus]
MKRQSAELLNLDKAWKVSMPLPKLTQAKQYKRILCALGHESAEPEEVQDGWIVRWRPQKRRA